MKKILVPIVIVLIIIISIVIVFNGDTEINTPQETIETESTTPTGAVNWQEITLKDIRTQSTYTIQDSEKPIVLETFAVWCPTCKQQQDQIKKLIEQGDDSIHISLNTDPNEDEEQVVTHINTYSYNWKFSIFPAEATKSLIEEFGIGIVTAPSAPIVIICPGQKGKLLRRGVKSAEELKEEIEKC